MSSGAGASGARHQGTGFRILLGCAIATVVLGIYGYSQAPTGECALNAPHGFWHYFEAVYKTFALFHPEHANADSVARCHPNWATGLAAILGPASFFAAIGGIVWVLLDNQRKAWLLRRAKNHAVIVGYGGKGRERAQESAHDGDRVVAIESAATESAIAHAKEHGVLLVEGDAREERMLARARIDHAASVVVATGDDARNLSLARAIADRIRKGRGRNVHASIGNPLIRRALTSSELPGNIDIFSTEEFAAYGLCNSARFFAVADLLGHARVHVVIVGFGPLATHLTAQIIRTNLLSGLTHPAITILCSHPQEARNALRLAYPGTDGVADIRTLKYDPLGWPPDDGSLMDEVEKVGPVTAVVVLNEGAFEAVPNALAIREAARRSGRWPAPIFFAIEAHEHFGTLEHPLKGTKRYSDVLQPFDTSAALCTMRHTRERDRIARAIHERYLHVQQEHRARGIKPSNAEALRSWDDLPLTFRQASRRAADHIPAKLASAGCIVPDGALNLSIDVDQILGSPLFETLAELEHDAWAIDRRLEGWRPGPVRDDASRIHDQLVPYDKLPDEAKMLDRDQIRTLLAETLPRTGREPSPNAVRFDLWVGLIGTTNVGAADAPRLAEEVAETISRVVEARPSHYITLLSPLAPGADLIATKKALAVLEAARRPHRLLVPNAVRSGEVVDSFEARWRAGAVADLDIPAGGDWPAARKRILEEIDKVIARADCERVIELDRLPLQTDERQRQRGYRLQNAYIIGRAHVVIAAVKGDGPVEPGGTREAMLWRRSPSTIPEEFRRFRKRPNPLGAGLSDLVTVELGAG